MDQPPHPDQASEFAILVAYGYTGSTQGRVWGLRASPRAHVAHYTQAARAPCVSLGRPSVVSDDNLAVSAAIDRLWPPQHGPSLPQPFLFTSEHHLRLRAPGRPFETDNAHAPRGRWVLRLDTAFRRSEGWEEFHDAASSLGAPSELGYAEQDEQLRGQTAVRRLLPAHHDEPLGMRMVQRLCRRCWHAGADCMPTTQTRTMRRRAGWRRSATTGGMPTQLRRVLQTERSTGAPLGHDPPQERRPNGASLSSAVGRGPKAG